MLTSCEIDDYCNMIEELGAIGGLGESNDDLIKAAMKDVNEIIKAGLHLVDINTLQSNTVNYIVNNMARNGEDVTDLNLDMANSIAGWIMINLLSAMMMMTDNFFVYQIDVEETNVYERDYTEFTCQVRLDIYQNWTLEDDMTLDAARLVNAIYQMYALGTARCTGVRREISAVFRAH